MSSGHRGDGQEAGRAPHRYNQRSTWLIHAHAALERAAVWAANGWDNEDPAAVPEDEILSRLQALNLERSSSVGTSSDPSSVAAD